ncbi:MAG: adenosylcobinamide-phosphate synthase CbiB [Clostridiales bacterium]|jgi:adenosylcobinamide-phosphate synthase|nr:adenosylcobinamide-phosphate synthase CbiB [Clostridiales bacterium]
MLIFYSASALAAGFALDLIIGDPHGWPHIVRGMGALINLLEHVFYPLENKRLGGTLLTVITLLACSLIPAFLLYGAFCVSPRAYFALETILCWQLLAVRSLKTESDNVYEALKKRDICKAREAVSMIVGRDAENLDETGVTRAAVETVAENTSDGVIAPMFFIALGGAAAGCLYKAANTLDSMIGYKNERYVEFGRFAAKFDDVLNFVPSRLSAVLMIIAAWIGRMDAKNALYIWKRDRLKHASPNAAQTEAAAAGALGVRLAGNAYYFGKLYEKPYIGDDNRPIEAMDIRRAHKLLHISSALMLALALTVRIAFYASV